MAVKRPKGVGKTRSSSNRKGYYAQKCPKCNGTGLFLLSNMYGEADMPCDLCGRRGMIELSYSTDNYSKEEGAKICQYIIKKLENKCEDSMGYLGSEGNPTEDLIKKDKYLAMVYDKLND